ncbi:hypothetical protein [Pseudonocardia sp. WMMC193]|uniref:hypothetical protein n=1 Tax=Pseudonocardia sp. WMMC193 TaxID=2911965 RepID=UPI001F340663|nr:hypothetical protein [Pseudonocardia sp. WMMC193]MCF7548508.1 hypothetical protein [Pseudonocardia sp. WMMC193]
MSNREQLLREQATAKGWTLLPYDVTLPTNQRITGWRLIADDGYVVMSRGGTRVLDPPAHLVMDLEEVEDALKHIECRVLRCGSAVGDVGAIEYSGRRIELALCVSHKRELDSGAAWSYRSAERVLLLGDDALAERETS